VLEKLSAANLTLQAEVNYLKERQIDFERRCQLEMDRMDMKIEVLSNQFIPCNEQGDLNVFHAPDTISWFTGRQSQMEQLETILFGVEKLNHSSARKAAICGLGGNGKTSLAVEYAHRMENHYQGGVFWFSGEDGTKLENSVNSLALSIGTFVANSFDVTLSQTLARISRIKKSWLLIIDDMDELQLSPSVRKLLSGSWQNKSNGHIIVTTRRKPSTLVNEVQVFRDSSCLELQCFNADDSKEFLFNRTGIPRNEDTEAAAHTLFEELGGLPLALEQAAAYIKSLGCSFTSYLESYKAQRLALLNQQPTKPVSEYFSPERLAVQTTWRLNIDYIKQNSEGRNAIRFLNACVFFNPDQIQEELINVGEPPVKDHQFHNSLGTSLGRYQILKLLTDFSLFKKSGYRCLQVHRLVLDVVKESLTTGEQEESFVNSVRFLQYGFSQSYSPDKILSGVADNPNPSLFYMWRTLCMHAGEIEKNLKNILLDRCNYTETSVFLPETARMVYQYALYLSVFCRHEEAVQAMNFALKILDWIPGGESELSVKLNSFFPHVVPLPESIRRHVQYCSKAPACPLPSGNDEQCVDSSIEVEALEFEKLREEGNKLFGKGRYQEAVDLYSGAIERKNESKFLDPRFFSNRASAYLRLGRYYDALEDAKAYISQSPKCWKGYARKSLALHGLNDELDAKLAACQTYILNPEVLTEYKLFSEKFSDLKQCIMYPVRALESAMSEKVICLRPGTYDISQNVSFQDCIVLGFDEKSSDMSKVKVNFVGLSSAHVVGRCAFANLEFVFQQGHCHCLDNSTVAFQNCSFTSHSEKCPSLDTAGVITVENCEFKNCNAGGLLCVRGCLSVENCTFYGNKKAALEVRESGTLLARNVNMHHNYQGLRIGPKAKKCILSKSQVNNSKREGVYCADSCCDESVNVCLKNNTIFHNNTFGISVIDSTAEISGNNVFENSYWGVWVQSNSCCHISRNQVNRNRVGGVRIGLRARGYQPSVVDSNTINDNGGPGIFQDLNDFEVNGFIGKQIYPVPSMLPFQTLPQHLQSTLVRAQCKENTTLGNKEVVQQPKGIVYTTQSAHRFCSYCKKEATLLKCGKCYTAEYCGPLCQKKHWELLHKRVCPNLIERSSVLLTSTKRHPVSPKKNETVLRLNLRPSGLQEVGSKFKPPPKNGKRFIVKVQTDDWNDLMLIYDRSQDVHEFFHSDHIQNLVRDLGSPCEDMYINKKLFMWATFTKNEIIRLLTNDFPPYQQW
jgi:parallel beta-helix repeat protein